MVSFSACTAEFETHSFPEIVYQSNSFPSFPPHSTQIYSTRLVVVLGILVSPLVLTLSTNGALTKAAGNNQPRCKMYGDRRFLPCNPVYFFFDFCYVKHVGLRFPDQTTSWYVPILLVNDESTTYLLQ